MVGYNFLPKIINVYNGIGKDIVFVNEQEHNKKCFTRRVISGKSKALDVVETDITDICIGGVNYPGSKKHGRIYPFEGFEKYDVIIVTQSYARAARSQSLFKEDTVLMDYVDRLYYVSASHFLSDIEEVEGVLRVNELRKVVRSHGFHYYMQRIKEGGNSSLVAMLQCMQVYKDMYSALDKVTRCYVTDFEERLQDIIMERTEKLIKNVL